MSFKQEPGLFKAGKQGRAVSITCECCEGYIRSVLRKICSMELSFLLSPNYTQAHTHEK